MAYRAIRNFRIARKIYDVGAIYDGSDIQYLLDQKLIELIPEIESQKEIIEMPKSEVIESEKPVKKKKKKGD